MGKKEGLKMAAYDKNLLNIRGRIVGDPELRHTPNGTGIVSFTIVSNHGKNPEDGSFFDVKAFDFGNRKTASFISEHFHAKDEIDIVGRIKQERWEDKQGGGKRSKVVIVADQVYFCGGKAGKPSEAQNSPVDDDIPF